MERVTFRVEYVLSLGMRRCYHLISKDGVETKGSITIARRRVCISGACFFGFADNFRSTKLGYSRDSGVFFP